jgi:hypothetical protein
MAEEDKLSIEERSFTLPDESIVEVPKKCRYDATEILFDFARLDSKKHTDYNSLAEMAIYSINKCCKEIKSVHC